MKEFLIISSLFETFSKSLMTSVTLDMSVMENEKSLVLDGNSEIGLYVIKFIAGLLPSNFEK